MKKKSLFKTCTGYGLNFLKALTVTGAFIASNQLLAQTTQNVNPTSDVSGFALITSENAIAIRTESEGAWAVGGDLVVDGTFQLFGGTTTLNNDLAPTAVVVEGKVDWVSGQIKVLNGQYMYLGNTAGSTVHDDGTSQNNTKLTFVGGTPTTFNKSIVLQNQLVDQSLSSLTRNSGIDFSTTFDDFYSTSEAIAELEENVIQDNSEANKTKVTLANNTTNVLTMTAQEFNSYSELVFTSITPSASSPLVINITDAVDQGALTINSWPNIPGNALGYAAYILYNFPSVTSSINYTGGAGIYGTIYAPYARFNNRSNSNIDGQIVARAYEQNSGELHPIPFDTDIEIENCEKPADLVTDATICEGEEFVWSVNGEVYTTTQDGLRIENDECTADYVLNLTVIAPLCPTEPAKQFNVFTSGDAIAIRTESEGAWAVGGDFTVNGTFQLFGGTTTFGSDNAPSALIVDGKVNWVSGEIKILDGQYMHLGDPTGTLIHDDGSFNNNTRLTPQGGSYSSNPGIVLQDQVSDQSTASILSDPGVDFTDAFNQFVVMSDLIAQKSTNVTWDLNEAQNGRLKLQLTAGETNVINLTMSELNSFNEIGFLSSVVPSPTTPLIVNITDVVNAPQVLSANSWPNVPGNPLAYASYILFNFPNVNTTINYTGGAQIYGTIYAPHARFNDRSNHNIDGQIIARVFEQNSGEVHPKPFGAKVYICDIFEVSAPSVAAQPLSIAPSVDLEAYFSSSSNMTIKYSVSQETTVTIDVFDLLTGEHIASVTDEVLSNDEAEASISIPGSGFSQYSVIMNTHSGLTSKSKVIRP